LPFSLICPPPASRETAPTNPVSPLQILTQQIRSEIASSSERAYPSLPLSSTKSLLFLDSEGAVIEFARERGWIIRDGSIFFPADEGAEDGDDDKEVSQMVIRNTLGYARELETIV
jgi:26S proteasome regulatory subunit N12